MNSRKPAPEWLIRRTFNICVENTGPRPSQPSWLVRWEEKPQLFEIMRLLYKLQGSGGQLSLYTDRLEQPRAYQIRITNSKQCLVWEYTAETEALVFTHGLHDLYNYVRTQKLKRILT